MPCALQPPKMSSCPGRSSTAEWWVRGGGAGPRADTSAHSRRATLYSHSPLSVLLAVLPPNTTIEPRPSYVALWPRRGLGPVPAALTSTHSHTGAALGPPAAPPAVPPLAELLPLHALCASSTPPGSAWLWPWP
jgi:hypothetical protein